jgi:hypothetical protein
VFYQAGPEIDIGIGVYGLPENADMLLPSIGCAGGARRQPYRIVFIGEKVSLRPILLPIAQRVEGELILPSGELSDTLLYAMAKRAAADGRPCVVFYFADFDPAGYHMPRVVSRKLQALRDLKFPDLSIELHRVALTIEQCIEYDLPSTPLKASERRGDTWRARWGREQTEIDALAALRPEILRQIAEAAVAPFYDPTLVDRHRKVTTDWQVAARRLVRGNPRYLAGREEIEDKLAEVTTVAEEAEATFTTTLEDAIASLQEAQERLDDALKDDIELPPPYEPVEPIIDYENQPEPLYSSDDDWTVATQKLIADKHGEDEDA